MPVVWGNDRSLQYMCRVRERLLIWIMAWRWTKTDCERHWFPRYEEEQHRNLTQSGYSVGKGRARGPKLNLFNKDAHSLHLCSVLCRSAPLFNKYYCYWVLPTHRFCCRTLSLCLISICASVCLIQHIKKDLTYVSVAWNGFFFWDE